jgi:hypothetical protein
VGAPASTAADDGVGLGGGDQGWESGVVAGRYAAGSARANLNPRQKMALQQARRQGREGRPAGLATATMTAAAASAAAAEYVRQGLEAVRAQGASATDGVGDGGRADLERRPTKKKKRKKGQGSKAKRDKRRVGGGYG